MTLTSEMSARAPKSIENPGFAAKQQKEGAVRHLGAE